MYNSRRKKVEKEVDIPFSIEDTKLETNDEITSALEKYNGFARSLFGNDYEVGKVKIKRGQQDPLKISMLKVSKEFQLAQIAKGNSEATIKTYQKHFNWIYEFLGFNYLMQGKDVVEDAVARELGTSREIGASMPVIVLELDNIVAYYIRYLKKQRNLSQQTVISALRHFRAIVYFTQDKGWVKQYNIKIKEIPPDPKTEFTDEELKKIGRKPKLTEDNIAEYRCYVMIKYLIATGNRISSVLALNVGDIDFEKGTIRVVVQKNKQPRVMPLNYDLRHILREWIYRCRSDADGMPLYEEPLFCNRTGGRLTYDGASDAMEDYFMHRGVEWSGFHKFRYSYATHWIRDGGNPLLLKEQLGHSSLTMTNRYVLMTGTATREEAEQHSLIKKVPEKTGRKAIKIKK